MRRRTFVGFACLCAMIVLATVTVDSPQAAQKKSDGQAIPIVSKESSKVGPDKSGLPAKKPAAHAMTKGRSRTDSQASAQGQSEFKQALPKANRAVKVHKKVLPKAVVQPRTDLMFYGVLEDPQRYDPRPNSPSGGLLNPQSPDLTYDHFQELDRNQDGKIDPVERAFGRIDMDRDLHTRTLQ
jgi:hypothetical protein